MARNKGGIIKFPPKNETDVIYRPNDTQPTVPGIDFTPSMYDLTNLFYSFYRYHNDDCMQDYEDVDFYSDPTTRRIKANITQKSLSRFAVLRRIIALYLNSRPYIGNVGVAPHKPNVNLGYFQMLMRYVSLPYKAVTSEKDQVKILFNRKLLEANTLSAEERKQMRMEAQENPNIFSNKEIGDDVSDCFNQLLNTSASMQRVADYLGTVVARDGFGAILHSDTDWTAEPIDPLDLVTEPQAQWDTDTWSNFFIVRKMTAQEAVRIVRAKKAFWNIDALKWSLENSQNGRGIFNNYYTENQNGYIGNDMTPLCGENFMVKSFYLDKSKRTINLHNYYGNLLIAEAYYINKNGNIQKTIFFPSQDFYNVPPEARMGNLSEEALKSANLIGADVLFTRELKDKKSIKDVLTIIPFNRAEPTLERQRAYGHELFNPVEMIMRVDTSILNVVSLMSVLFVKNRNEGATAQDNQDLEIKFTGEVQQMGDREFIDSPLTHDLNAMIAVRSLLVDHAMAKGYLSGLDGGEAQGQGRGADFARYRLVRDGRIHKHDIEDFGKGQTELYSKTLRSVLEEMDSPDSVQDTIVKRLFTDQLLNLYGYDKEYFEFDNKDVIPDTRLPYWMRVEALRNGASHMGPAEMVLYSEIKQVFGDGFTKAQLDNLNRMGIKAVLGPQDALDILGDPKDQLYTDQDQIYQASMENAAILGAVSMGLLNFEPVGIRETKDDPIAHLTQIHNPKSNEILEILRSGEATPEEMDAMSEQDLEDRITLTLKLAALNNHSSLHLQQLEFFGKARDDVNALKEETNNIIQAAEGLLGNLQISLRALKAKRADQQMRLQNMSPENEIERAKIEKELMDLQVKNKEVDGKLALANKIEENSVKKHMDTQLTKARDRAQKDRQATADRKLKSDEIALNAAIKAQEIKAKKAEKKKTLNGASSQ